MSEFPSGFLMALREAKYALDDAVRSAPDDGFHCEAQRCLNRVEELLNSANRMVGGGDPVGTSKESLRDQ